MPNPPPKSLIFEPFIETDEIIFSSKSVNDSDRLIWKGDKEWIEVTVGVVGKHGEMHSLSPSITVKETGDILSLEEKFQGMFLSEIIYNLFQCIYEVLPIGLRSIEKYIN